MKTILLLAMLIPVAQGKVMEADPPGERPEWFVCEKAGDCIDIRFACAGNVVNKKFQKDAETFYRQQAMTMNCAEGSAPTSKQPRPVVSCEKKICRISESSPK